MAYPNVPDLTAFNGKWVPNLLTGGPYDEQLTKVEDYLNQLGAYVDSQLTELRESVSAQMQDIRDQLAEDAERLDELDSRVGELSQWQENAGNIVVNVPTGIDSAGTGVNTSAVKLIEPTGAQGGAVQALANVAGNLMLAAPNEAAEQLLGWLGDNSRSAIEAPTVQASAALTYAAGQGGSAGAYGVPVEIGRSGGAYVVSAFESVTLHQYDTVLVSKSTLSTIRAGSVLQYVGSSSLALGVEPVPFEQDNFSTLWKPEKVPTTKNSYSVIPVETTNGTSFTLASEIAEPNQTSYSAHYEDFLLVVGGVDRYVGDLLVSRTVSTKYLYVDQPTAIDTKKICNVTELVGRVLKYNSKVTAQDLADGLGTAGRGIVMKQ